MYVSSTFLNELMPLQDLESLEARYQQKLSDLEKKQATLQTEWRRQIADLEKERDQLQEQHRKAYVGLTSKFLLGILPIVCRLKKRKKLNINA